MKRFQLPQKLFGGVDDPHWKLIFRLPAPNMPLSVSEVGAPPKGRWPMSENLSPRRALIVEDEYLIAFDIEASMQIGRAHV